MVPTSPLSIPDNALNTLNSADKENEHSELSAVKAATKKRKRKSIGQQSLFKKKRSSGSLRPHLPTPPQTQEETLPEEGTVSEEATMPVEEPLHSSQSARPQRRWSIASSDPPQGIFPTLSPAEQITQQPEATFRETPGLAQSKRRKKRKSIIQGKTKRHSSGTVASTASQIAGSIEGNDELEHDEEQEEEGEEPNELSFDFEAGAQSDHQPENEQLQPVQRAARTSTRSRRFTSEGPEQISPGDDDEADDTFLPDEATPGPTPAPRRAKQKLQQKPSRRRARNTVAASRPIGVQKQPQKSTFPILTHRMTNLHALPTIAEVPEEDQQHDSETDELALPTSQAITTRTTPNAVDVLAQVCREAIDGSISDVKTQSQDLPRADLNRRLTALESFRSTLDTRLFDLSQSLDQRLTMEARLRKVRREKAELQSRWLEIRRQRDQLDLRKDVVRRTHWEGEVLNRKKFEASQAAFAAEGAIGQESGQHDELEFRLRQVAGDVSAVDGGGVLQTLKTFNAQLERLAGALG